MAAGKLGNSVVQTGEKAADAGKKKGATRRRDKRPIDWSKLKARRGRWLIVVVALMVGLAAWTASQGDDDAASPPAIGAQPRTVSESELKDIAAATDHPIYWAGPLLGMRLEVSEAAGGVLVTYAASDSKPTADRRNLLAIGSYPLPDAASAVAGFGEREGAIVNHSDEGTEVVTSTQAPNSVYFASSDGAVQIEVYDPSPERALELALSGQVRPVSPTD